MTNRARTIGALAIRVGERAPGIVAGHWVRLDTKMAEMFRNTQLNGNRILTEAVVYTDKANIDEETVHLHSHLSQLDHVLAQEKPVSRKLDFPIQGFDRKTNTVGSGYSDIETTRYVVDIEVGIGKIRG